MIIFAKFGEYKRREFIEACLEKYLTTINKTKLSENTCVENGVNNKPFFKDYPFIHFSISHSGNLVVLAMSDTEVGIDVEEVKSRPYEALAKRVFSDDERAEISDINSFFKMWTKKEAYLKLISEGIGGVQSADVSKPVEFMGKPVVFTTLEILEGYIGAVVAHEQPIIFEMID